MAKTTVALPGVLTFFAAFSMFDSSAHSQEAETPPPGDPTPSEAQPVANDERIAKLEGRIEGLTKQAAATSAIAERLDRLKLSGYVQARYEWHDDAAFGLDPNNPSVRRGLNRFLVRRARLKTSYAGDHSEVVLQIDAVPDGVAVRDAEASLVLDSSNVSWGGAVPWKLKLTMGQFKVPFGFEILQSSSDRELPERTTMVRRLFPGERDRGLRLGATVEWLRLGFAVINGNLVNDPVFGTFDQTSWKDVIGRLGADFDFLAVGISGHYGRALKATVGRAGTSGMPAVPSTYERFARLRVGGDAQLTFDVPGLGGLALRGEAIWARDDSLSFSGVPGDPCKDVASFGWAGTIVQSFGRFAGLAVRVDQFDPNFGVDGGCPEKTRTDASVDKVTTVGAALLGYISRNLKLTVAYEHIDQQGPNEREDDTFTVQLQARY